ncbi:TetR/AcrR family transcriptional regulator [Halieaceae bacterium IMCC14734]|uniref:TetR/AcrR family transcriptional regulator n=1 Tax=Candidatus Litorirhabdus singularis TaxID=2518993 RepID=A0ABT3TEU9_9GAMM|nr:helix-turn-helix domain containing protein [Candidatus Litorirhabdus singularis]MCX2980826.1 TetR/AcrR family transcriptional regulator [Candidatus Litorirhabdus singularis]
MSKNPETTILNAAHKCYLKDGISKTGMREVALAAGVARSTLYRYFPSRDDVLVAVIKQEMDAANRSIQSRLSRYSEPQDIIVEGLILALREIPRRPLLRAVFASDEDATARRIVWGSQLIVGFGEELMENVIGPALAVGLLKNEVKPEIMIEWVYRVLLSFLTLPSNWIRNDKQLRTTLHALLVPVLLH